MCSISRQVNKLWGGLTGCSAGDKATCFVVACVKCYHFLLYLTVWGVEPVVTHQTSWLESTGVSSKGEVW